MQQVWLFFAGALLCNCVPHLVAGLQGLPFPTPFAKPRGIGNSSALVNVLWGFANLVVGLLIVARHASLSDAGSNAAALLAGALVIGIFLAVHFGKVQRDRQAG